MQFRATDVAGFTSAWAPAAGTAGATVRIDRTAPTAPTVTGGSNGVAERRLGRDQRLGGQRQRLGRGLLPVPDIDQRRHDLVGGGLVGHRHDHGQGTTIVQFRSVDGAGNVSAWAPAAATAGSTARIDRTPPSLPTVSGGSLTCAATRTITGSGSTDTRGSGGVHYQYQVSTDGGATYGAAVVEVECDADHAGELRGAVPGRGCCGQRVRLGARLTGRRGQRLHRLTAASDDVTAPTG